MTVSVHNPDQYMASLRQIIAQGRKRIGLLVGAGASAGIFPPGSDKIALQSRAESCQQVRRNGWCTAIYQVFSGSDWFCDGGFQEQK